MSESMSVLDILALVFQFFKSFWWLVALASIPTVVPLVFRIITKSIRYQRISRAGLVEVDSMNGEAFEIYLESLFSRMGYHVKRTPYRGDYGADLIVTKDGKSMAVQAKRAASKVGVKAVQEITAARAHYKCDSALVVTNNDFTQQAQKLARSNNVDLWNRERLATVVNKTQPNSLITAQKA
jgi:restriction system protein